MDIWTRGYLRAITLIAHAPHLQFRLEREHGLKGKSMFGKKRVLILTLRDLGRERHNIFLFPDCEEYRRG